MNPVAWGTLFEFPVFKPNDYFFKNHVREGEDKADAYGRVIQSIIAKQMNLQIADVDIKEKLAYREMIFGKYNKYV